jgi:parallel beta-helix repeat protein
VLTLPGCTYRGAVRITKPLTVVALPGAEIRGNDVWTAWNGQVSVKALRAMSAGGECMDGAPACPAVEQVLVDGARLARVADRPGPGQFALDPSRHVVLGRNPAGHTVEVTTRQFWMEIASSDVTVAGLIMRYAANRAQTGALRVDDGVRRVTIRDVDLGYASGAGVSFGGASDSTLLRAAVHDNGQLGVHLGGDAANGRGNRVLDSRIYRNNTARFDPEWEAGGLKATVQSGLLVAGTEVYDNVGPGIWCDIYCLNVTFRDNRVHDNTYAGIMFEVSTGARIYGNVVYRNGAGKAEWGWGAGILVSSSGGADVHDNVLAWNARSGVSIISQLRTDWPKATATNNNVHGNATLALHGTWLMFWAQDFPGALFDASSNNRGAGNRYWIAGGPPDGDRFAWESGTSSLAAFNATPAEEDGAYLTTSEKNAVAKAAGIPASP